MRIRSLHVYPVKGARGIDLARADVLRTGIRHDRRFMVVDAEGIFVTQRTHAQMARVATAIDEHHLRLSFDDARLDIPLAPEGPTRQVRVWDDAVEAVSVDRAFFTRVLGMPAELVWMPPTTRRSVGESPDDDVGFADAFPLLVASQASLDELNARLRAKGEREVTMDRFRPNVVIEGNAAFDEDARPTLRLGALPVRLPRGCSRCKVITIDQTTATAGKEPLRTLATYRARDGKVYFGMNAIPDEAPVTIAVGDAVT